MYLQNQIDILDYLYRTYYETHTKYSPVTSAHWVRQGKDQIVRKSGGGYSLSGEGFGDFERDNFVNNLKNIPIAIFVSKMLGSCDGNIVTASRNVAKVTKRYFSYDMARMALTASLLSQHMGGG